MRSALETTYRRRIGQLDEHLRGRSLYYFGTRGADAAPLTALEGFAAAFTQIAPLDALGVKDVCLETLTGRRVDLDAYAIDADEESPAVRTLRREMLACFERRGDLMAYRSTATLASAWFPRSEFVRFHGLFHEFQGCFEHKPWVESALAAAGVPVVDWEYYCDDERSLIVERTRRAPVVLRSSRSDGGTGVKLARDPANVDAQWPYHEDGFVAVAPYLHPNIPLNINACVWRDGRVTLHGPSVQLIGVPGCTNHAFGYCGNDFAAAARLAPRHLTALDELTRGVGRWLASQGYCGAFGVDALVHEDRVVLVELNPRFQGSSRWAAQLDRAIGRPDQFLEHLAAFMGLAPCETPPLTELVATYPPLAHVVVHNCASTPARRNDDPPPNGALEVHLDPTPGTLVDPGGISWDLVAHESVLESDLVSVRTSLLQSLDAARISRYVDA